MIESGYIPPDATLLETIAATRPAPVGLSSPTLSILRGGACVVRGGRGSAREPPRARFILHTIARDCVACGLRKPASMRSGVSVPWRSTEPAFKIPRPYARERSVARGRADDRPQPPREWPTLPLVARGYVALITALGAAAIAFALPQITDRDAPILTALAVLSVMTAFAKTTLPVPGKRDNPQLLLRDRFHRDARARPCRRDAHERARRVDAGDLPREEWRPPLPDLVQHCRAGADGACRVVHLYLVRRRDGRRDRFVGARVPGRHRHRLFPLELDPGAPAPSR